VIKQGIVASTEQAFGSAELKLLKGLCFFYGQTNSNAMLPTLRKR
jgi:hypothetical protein